MSIFVRAPSSFDSSRPMQRPSWSLWGVGPGDPGDCPAGKPHLETAIFTLLHYLGVPGRWFKPFFEPFIHKFVWYWYFDIFCLLLWLLLKTVKISIVYSISIWTPLVGSPQVCCSFLLAQWSGSCRPSTWRYAKRPFPTTNKFENRKMSIQKMSKWKLWVRCIFTTISLDDASHTFFAQISHAENR